MTAFNPIEEIGTDGRAMFDTSSVKCQNVPLGLDVHLSTAKVTFIGLLLDSTSPSSTVNEADFGYKVGAPRVR